MRDDAHVVARDAPDTTSSSGPHNLVLSMSGLIVARNAVFAEAERFVESGCPRWAVARDGTGSARAPVQPHSRLPPASTTCVSSNPRGYSSSRFLVVRGQSHLLGVAVSARSTVVDGGQLITHSLVACGCLLLSCGLWCLPRVVATPDAPWSQPLASRALPDRLLCTSRAQRDYLIHGGIARLGIHSY